MQKLKNNNYLEGLNLYRLYLFLQIGLVAALIGAEALSINNTWIVFIECLVGAVTASDIISRWKSLGNGFIYRPWGVIELIVLVSLAVYAIIGIIG